MRASAGLIICKNYEVMRVRRRGDLVIGEVKMCISLLAKGQLLLRGMNTLYLTEL